MTLYSGNVSKYKCNQ